MCTKPGSILLAITVVLFSAPALAQSSDVIGIISLLGDEFTVVTRTMNTGSHLEKDNKESLPSHFTGLDQFAMASAASAIELKNPEAVTVMLWAKDKNLYEGQFSALVDGDASGGPQWLRVLAANEGINKILIFTKYRGAGSFKSENGAVGAGHVRGLGFYMDYYQTDVSFSANGASDIDAEGQRGFLAPFVYMTATLIDARTFKVLRQHIVTQSKVFWVAGSKGILPWDVLDAKEKVDALKSLTEKAASEGAELVM